MKWYLELSVLEQVFFWIAIVATVLLVIQLILMLVSFGGMDGDADGAFDDDIDSDSGLSYFSLKSITAFFVLGGWCGFAAASYIDNIWAPILISVASGLAAFFAFAFAMRAFLKLRCSGNLVTEKLVGMSATTYVSIPSSHRGRGKITLTAQGKYMELDAVTDDEERIRVDEIVEILKMDGDCALVKRKDKEI